MDLKKIIVLAALIVILAILVVVFFTSGGKEKIRMPSVSPAPSEEIQVAGPAERKKVTLFFLSDEDGLLHPEEREIIAGTSVIAEAQRVIEELIRGSQEGLISSLPPEAKLRQVFVTREGVAYVDFSREFVDKHPSGSAAEIATIYAIVNSLTFNFKTIKRVFILVDGNERETLGGHINLTRSFLPQMSLVAKD
jgi:spore germination protein GerM